MGEDVIVETEYRKRFQCKLEQKTGKADSIGNRTWGKMTTWKQKTGRDFSVNWSRGREKLIV